MNHTGFVISDMERALAFYRDVLGLKEERNARFLGFSRGDCGDPPAKPNDTC